MKKYWLMALAILAGFSAAAEPKKHSLEIAYEYSSYTYREPHMDYPIKLHGVKNGISAVYTMHSVLSMDSTEDDPSFASLGFRYMDGNTKYEGWLEYWDGRIEPDSVGGLKDYYFEADLKLGRTCRLAETLELAPYFGIGWRQLTNHLEEGGEGGYKRTQTYVYIPLGTNLRWDVTSQFAFTLNGQFDWMIYGNNNSGLVGEYDMYNRDSVSFRQDQGYGLRFSVKAEVNMGKVGLFIEPFWRYWHIQNSEKQYFYLQNPDGSIDYDTYLAYQEPFNTTKEYGVKIGLSF